MQKSPCKRKPLPDARGVGIEPSICERSQVQVVNQVLNPVRGILVRKSIKGRKKTKVFAAMRSPFVLLLAGVASFAVYAACNTPGP